MKVIYHCVTCDRKAEGDPGGAVCRICGQQMGEFQGLSDPKPRTFESLTKDERVKMGIIEHRRNPKLQHLTLSDNRAMVKHVYKITDEEYELHCMEIDDDLEKWWNLYYEVLPSLQQPCRPRGSQP